MDPTLFAYAHHDLTGVRVIEIQGWTGRHQVLPKAGCNPQVTLEVTSRALGDHWIFGDVHEGVLGCHSGLVGSPTLTELAAEPVLNVDLPPRKIPAIEVRLV